MADLTTLANVKAWLGLTGLAIATISKANPAVITLETRPASPMMSGTVYTVEGVNMAGVNGTWSISVLTPTTFTIPVDTTLADTYTTGGVVGISDPLLGRMITSVSAFVETWLNRTIPSASYSENRNGPGGSVLPLDNFPILSVQTLSVDGLVIPPRPALGSPVATGVGFGFGVGPAGYVFDDGALYISGWTFNRGWQNVAVSYTAGYQISDEPHTIPVAATFDTMRWSAGDRGLTYQATGVALTAVSGVPAAGEYTVSGSTYTFNAADVGAVVLVSYAVVPYDLEQAVIDTVGDWYRYIARVGKTSQAIEQQSTVFTNTMLPVRAQGVLNQYRKVAPVSP
jgi:hypothetical protein